MNLIYLDLKDSGISGDIFLSGLLQLVEEPEIILRDLEGIKNFLSGVSILELGLKEMKKNELKVYRLEIKIKESKHHRSVEKLKDALSKYMDAMNYSIKAKEYAKNVLDSLVLAEAEVHENLPEKVHLHELSSVDTLLDILGVTRTLDEIGYFSDECKIYLSILPLGGGKIKSAHGILPVPAPATAKLLENSSLIIKMGPVESEITTPTGVALLKNLNIETIEPQMVMKKTAYSTGQKIFDNFLNIMKVYFGKDPLDVKDTNAINFEKYHQKIALLETNLDDVSGEEIGNFINIMENEEVLDIQVTQGITKKNRPSYIIKVLCHPKYVSSNITKIIGELGTLGVRFSIVDRYCVDRVLKKSHITIFNNSYEFSYKLSYFENYGEKYIVNIKPEFEDLKKIGINAGISLKKLSELVINQILKEIGKSNFIKKFKTKKKK